MSSILETVEWGQSILNILSHTKKLDPNLPAIMHIRHTERPMNPLGNPEGFTLLSTEQGKQGAYELGSRLPTNRKYRIYHTIIERTRETALEIQRGLASNNVKSEVIDSFPLSTVVTRAKFSEIAKRESAIGLGLQEIGTRWLSNHYPPWARVPSLDFAQRGASFTIENLKSADNGSFDVYVSHDTFIAPFLFHWFGIYPVDWVKFLEGFILQLTEEKMIVITKDGKKELYYPYWWNF